MSTITVDVAAADLRNILRGLRPGEQLVITDDGEPIATVAAARPAAPKPRRLGALAGSGKFRMADDFNAPLEDMQEYMK